jgi:hypothetical protein
MSSDRLKWRHDCQQTCTFGKFGRGRALSAVQSNHLRLESAVNARRTIVSLNLAILWHLRFGGAVVLILPLSHSQIHVPGCNDRVSDLPQNSRARWSPGERLQSFCNVPASVQPVSADSANHLSDLRCALTTSPQPRNTAVNPTDWRRSCQFCRMQSMLPPSANLCCHLRIHQRVCKISSTPKACGWRSRGSIRTLSESGTGE